MEETRGGSFRYRHRVGKDRKRQELFVIERQRGSETSQDPSCVPKYGLRGPGGTAAGLCVPNVALCAKSPVLLGVCVSSWHTPCPSFPGAWDVSLAAEKEH